MLLEVSYPNPNIISSDLDELETDVGENWEKHDPSVFPVVPTLIGREIGLL